MLGGICILLNILCSILKTKVLTLAFALIVLVSSAQWQPWPEPTNNTIRAVCVPSAEVAYVAGGFYMKRTTDAGNTWTSLNTNGLGIFTDIEFVNTQTGFAIGGGGVFIRTTDGGDTWVFSTIAGDDLYTVYFIDEQIGFVGGDNGLLMRTANGGLTWTTLEIGSSATINGIVFHDPNLGYAMGNGGTILRTFDAGLTWTLVADVTSGTMNVLCQRPDGKLFVAGDHGKIYSAFDVTTPWTLEYEFDYRHIYGMAFYSNQIGYAIATDLWTNAGQILTTQNGGNTWSADASDTGMLFGIDISPDGVLGFIGGTGGDVFRLISEPNSTNFSFSNEENNALHIFPNPASDELSITLPYGVKQMNIELINAQGQVVVKKERYAGESISIRYLSEGVYFLNYQSEGVSGSEKVMVKH